MNQRFGKFNVVRTTDGHVSHLVSGPFALHIETVRLCLAAAEALGYNATFGTVKRERVVLSEEEAAEVCGAYSADSTPTAVYLDPAPLSPTADEIRLISSSPS